MGLAEVNGETGIEASGIMVHCAHDALVDLVNLVPNPRNPNKHPDKQIALLSKMIKHQGWRAPIVVSNRSGFIVTGHGRYSAAKMLAADLVPVNYQDFDTEADEYAHLIADNRIAELADMDQDGLKSILDDLKKWEVDPDLVGFSAKEIEKIGREALKTVNEATELPSIERDSGELAGVYGLKARQGLVFPSKAKFGIPELLPEMLMEAPDDLVTWAGHDSDSVKFKDRVYLYNWGTDSRRGLDMERTIISFYTDDPRFDGFWEAPHDFIGRLLVNKVMGMVTPNYSYWEIEPDACHIWAAYRARWVGRYAQEAGIKVIPDIDFTRESDLDICMEGVPKNCPCLCSQIHNGTKTPELIGLMRLGFKRVINELTPDQYIFYVGETWEDILDFDAFPDSLDVKIVKNRLQMRTQAMRSADKKFASNPNKNSSASK